LLPPLLVPQKEQVGLIGIVALSPPAIIDRAGDAIG
jgi:hypothetical protein